MGTYNQLNSETGMIPTTYFKLGTDIDMTGITLSPIGTDRYPFVGNFNGCGYTISNLTVSNDNPITSQSHTTTDFGIMKPTDSKLSGTTVPQIVGIFGVVGKFTEHSDCVRQHRS